MRKTGFTLLEVIIAITLLSLVALLVGGAARLSLRAWDRGEAFAEKSLRMRILSERFTRQIRSAYPYRIVTDGKRVALFEGRPDSLWFVASTANYLYGGFKWISFYVKDGSLFVKEGMVPDKQLPEKVAEAGELLEQGVEEIRFRYLSTDGEEWLDDWAQTDDLPLAVSVKLNGLSLVIYIRAMKAMEG